MMIPRSARQWILSLGIGALLGGCNQSAPPPPAASEPVAPPTRTVASVVSINELMVTMIDNASHVLWDIEAEGGAPKDDADWQELVDHAIQVAAAGTLIQLGGTGPSDGGWVIQPNWRTHAQDMINAAVAAREAATARNFEAVVKANGQLVDSCEGCHKLFKPDLPTEGITHQRPHSESHR